MINGELARHVVFRVGVGRQAGYHFLLVRIQPQPPQLQHHLPERVMASLTLRSGLEAERLCLAGRSSRRGVGWSKREEKQERGVSEEQ